jgi:hypothetical protein
MCVHAFCQTKPDKIPFKTSPFCRLDKHTVGVELLSIGSNPPPQQMRDEFSMKVVS